jgi:hypothetical protein
VTLTNDFDLDQLRAELRKMTDVERSQQGEARDCFRVADNPPSDLILESVDVCNRDFTLIEFKKAPDPFVRTDWVSSNVLRALMTDDIELFFL